MSEKLRNENLGESQRETFQQKDVQSPSVSSFDQKKEFFEHVLQDDVPKEEIKTEQKKDIIDDLQTIGQNQEGKSFDKKKEFFENIGEVKDDEKSGEKVSDTPRGSESQEKLSPTQEWRNKYEGPTQSPLGFEGSDVGGKDRSSQSQVLGTQQQGNSNESESFSSQKDTSLGSESNIPSFQQGKEGSSSQSQNWGGQQFKEGTSQPQDWSNQQKGSSIGSESFSSQKDTSLGSDVGGKDRSSQSQVLGTQQQGSSIGSESFSSQKDTSLGSESNVPSFQQGKEGSSSQSQNWGGQQGTSQPQDWSNQQKGSSIESESFSSQKDTSLGSESFSSQKDTSLGSDVSSPQEKKEGFSSFFPKEGSTKQQGDLISFGSTDDLSNQSQKEQETSLSSVSSTLPQETQGKDLPNKNDKLKSKRKKGFEPKDPLQKTNDVSNESGIEKK